jgi:hypothetical protein
MARRRKNKTTIPLGFLFLLSLFIVLLLIMMGFSPQDSLNIFLFIGLPIIFAILLIGFLLTLPAIKGKIGERKIALLLKRSVGRNSRIINDVIIPDENGKTSQIDHIVISPSGIHVIETKNISGRIYGDENQLNWTQVLQFGRIKNKIYNPFKQNKTHIFRLRKILGNSVKICSYVVFVQGNIAYIKADNIYTPRLLQKTLLNNNEVVVSDNEIERYYLLVQAFKNNPIQSNKEHITEIKETQAGIANNICPRCGRNLVLRKSKDGRQFYGCEGYPACRFTKKLN